LAFILSNPFYNVGLFSAMCVAYVAPAFMFLKTLMDKRAVPRFYMVPMPASLIWDSYDSLYKVLVGCMILVPYAILNSLTLVPWLGLGCLLYTTKSFAIRPVANLWLHVWTGSMFAQEGTPLWEQRRRDIELADWHPLDEKVLNESLMAHVFLETFPIVAVQFINNSLYRSWNALAIFSMAFSIFNSISGVYRIAYYRLYLKIPLTDVPVDFTVGGISVFGTETAKQLLGEGDEGEGGRAHRFSMSRSVSGLHTSVTDEWVDTAGHVHHEEVKAPLLQHVAEDLIKLNERVTKLETHILFDVGGKTTL